VRGKSHHLSMEKLLRFADGEMSFVESRRARNHLSACWDCRVQLRTMEYTIGELVELHHRTLNPRLPPIAESRALLKARLSKEASTSRNGLWLSSVSRASFRLLLNAGSLVLF